MAQQAAQFLSGVARLSLGVAAVGLFVDNCIYTVEGGQRGVVFDRVRGVLPEATDEGAHFIVPVMQKAVVMDVRSRPRQINSVTGTKDLQMVNISLRVLSRPRPVDLPKIFQTLGTDFDDRVLPSLGNEVLKAVVAQYNADELLSNRESISRQIKTMLTQRADSFGLDLDDVAITHLTFGKEFTRAIEFKQVAQQEAERSRFIVEKAKQERRAAIIRAEGESEAAQLISDALSQHGSGLIEVRRIDAAREIASRLSRSRNVTYLPGGNTNMLLNMGSA